MTGQLLTAEELADLLQVPVKTLYVWRGKNEGPPACKVGRWLRYRPDDVDAWLNQRANGGAR
jgi:excisionase family DNA binding protein